MAKFAVGHDRRVGLPPAGVRPWALLSAGLVATAGVGLAGFMLARAHSPDCASSDNKIIWANQITQEEGNNPNPPAGFASQAERFASCGAGQLILDVGAGQGGLQVGPASSLRIYREPGEIENDPAARENKVRQLVTHAFQIAEATRAPGSGRDIVGLLATISSQLGSGHNDVWLQTLGLPTVNPANVRVLMAADPAQAVASIARPAAVPAWRASTPCPVTASRRPATAQYRHGRLAAPVHCGLLGPAGGRRGLGHRGGHRRAARARGPTAPVIPNLPEPDAAAAIKPRPHQAYTAKLDSSTLFVPNYRAVPVQRSQVLNQLQPIITGWRRWPVLPCPSSLGTAPGSGHRRRATAQPVTSRQGRAAACGSTASASSRPKASATTSPCRRDPTSATNRVVIVTAYPKN